MGACSSKPKTSDNDASMPPPHPLPVEPLPFTTTHDNYSVLAHESVAVHAMEAMVQQEAVHSFAAGSSGNEDALQASGDAEEKEREEDGACVQKTKKKDAATDAGHGGHLSEKPFLDKATAGPPSQESSVAQRKAVCLSENVHHGIFPCSAAQNGTSVPVSQVIDAAVSEDSHEIDACLQKAPDKGLPSSLADPVEKNPAERELIPILPLQPREKLSHVPPAQPPVSDEDHDKTLETGEQSAIKSLDGVIVAVHQSERDVAEMEAEGELGEGKGDLSELPLEPPSDWVQKAMGKPASASKAVIDETESSSTIHRVVTDAVAYVEVHNAERSSETLASDAAQEVAAVMDPGLAELEGKIPAETIEADPVPDQEVEELLGSSVRPLPEPIDESYAAKAETQLDGSPTSTIEEHIDSPISVSTSPSVPFPEVIAESNICEPTRAVGPIEADIITAIEVLENGSKSEPPSLSTVAGYATDAGATATEETSGELSADSISIEETTASSTPESSAETVIAAVEDQAIVVSCSSATDASAESNVTKPETEPDDLIIEPVEPAEEYAQPKDSVTTVKDSEPGAPPIAAEAATDAEVAGVGHLSRSTSVAAADASTGSSCGSQIVQDAETRPENEHYDAAEKNAAAVFHRGAHPVEGISVESSNGEHVKTSESDEAEVGKFVDDAGKSSSWASSSESHEVMDDDVSAGNSEDGKETTITELDSSVPSMESHHLVRDASVEIGDGEQISGGVSSADAGQDECKEGPDKINSVSSPYPSE